MRRLRAIGLFPVLLAAAAACSTPVTPAAAVPAPTPVPIPTTAATASSSVPPASTAAPGSSASSPGSGSPGSGSTPPGPTQAGPTPAGPADAVRVTLGLYSGRPDPTWTLSASEAAAVERAIEALPEAGGTPPEGGLGYHGFTVETLGRTVTAYFGVVSAGGAGPQVLRTDPGRTVERLLLELGRTHLLPTEIAEVEQSLDGQP